ncbi:beta-ketoacyl-ACP synthase III [Porticoccus sp. W117]|uniref:beta-ketoacyl-ACP synthase III n=1 Tax=Porticoccus sp. W117 TaxID=3054777 RepID=UPI002591E2B3|nr:beta-ketoacyl-ACP synthase III [Porticoccus sp. W117]MDM3871702.1 beta-ketoacyl-ACP synthase III [Porticoccus sp. W117]
MQDAYITGVGRFLPGPTISNKEVEDYIGCIHGQPSAFRAATLRKNGIKTRHYAVDIEGNHLYTNAQMAAEAIRAAAANAKHDVASLQLLATSTTQGDLLVPGFASAVHGELGIPPLELASFQSVCASSMMAIKNAYLNIRSGDKQTAAACGSEFSSRWFRPGFYESCVAEEEARKPPIDLDFLRWTLSDGAGALFIEPNPKSDGVSLRCDWIDLQSFADRFDPCMYAGSSSNVPGENLPWSHYASPQEAYQAGAMALRQDFELLYKMFPVWLGYYLSLMDKHGFNPESIDYYLPHYSAKSLGEEMKKLMKSAGAMIPEERWFNNLTTVGNTGSASIFLMLEELLREQDLQPGQTILCFVPESGRCIASFMHLTVVTNKD